MQAPPVKPRVAAVVSPAGETVTVIVGDMGKCSRSRKADEAQAHAQPAAAGTSICTRMEPSGRVCSMAERPDLRASSLVFSAEDNCRNRRSWDSSRQRPPKLS